MKAISQRKKNSLQRKADRQLLIMCLPTILKLFIFSYVPLVGIWMAFVRYIPRKGIKHRVEKAEKEAADKA